MTHEQKEHDLNPYQSTFQSSNIPELLQQDLVEFSSTHGAWSLS
jgi:hypothetical protein